MNKKEDSLVFVHDHIFKLGKEGVYYSDGKFSDGVFERYRNGRDCVVNVVCREKKEDDISGLNGIYNESFKINPVKGSKFQYVFSFYLLNNFFLMIRLIKNANFAIIRFPSFLGVMAASICLLLGKKYYAEVVGNPKEVMLALGKGRVLWVLFSKFWSKINALFIYKAKAAIYVTKNSLQSQYPNKEFMYFASDVELIWDEKEKKIEDFHLKGNFPRLGIVGSYFNDYKGIDVAIRAIALLKARNCSCELHILGAGHKGRYLELAKELGVDGNVYFDGLRKSGEGVYLWLDELDCYLQPSRTEGLPRALVEAMSRGLPIVCSNVGGMPELLSKDFIFDKENHLHLAEKIYSIINDLDLRVRAGRENHSFSRNFDREVLDEKYFFFWGQAWKNIGGD